MSKLTQPRTLGEGDLQSEHALGDDVLDSSFGVGASDLAFDAMFGVLLSPFPGVALTPFVGVASVA